MKKKANVKIDPSLNQYQHATLFPEKLRRAKEFLKAHPLPRTLFIPDEDDFESPSEHGMQSQEK